MIARRRAAACAAAAALLLAGCTGVPDSSAPQVIRTIGAQSGPQPAVITPVPGADPRSIVRDFLENNVSDDEGHAAAKKFLTADARTTWNDNTATVLDSTSQISTLSNNTITVTGREVGALDRTGAYSPRNTGLQSFTFGMKLVGGQWRIDKLGKQGLLISAAQFGVDYQEQTVYFFDPAGQRLVPDPRYTSLTDPLLLARWLLSQYVTSPTPATLTSALPQIPNQTAAPLAVGQIVSIELPGANQLDGPTRDKMAAQVALTLDQAVSHDTPMTITDGGQPVTIPRAGGARFTWSQFDDLLSAANPEPSSLYYITPNGGVSTAQGSVPLAGGVGSGQYALKSVALATSASTGALLVAGVAGYGQDERLLVGRADRTLARVGIPAGPLTRPSWVPRLDEVWVGDGSRLYRVDATTGAAHSVPISSTAGGPVTDRIVAVRFSPEGARLALVLGTPSNTSLWIGTVNRSAPTVTVTLDDLSINPPSVRIADAAWNGTLKLFAVGHDSSNTPGVYEVHCDGSLWTPSTIGNLPGEPDSITVAADVVAAVSVGGTVWIQHGGSWASPNAALTYGTAPIYVE